MSLRAVSVAVSLRAVCLTVGRRDAVEQVLPIGDPRRIAGRRDGGEQVSIAGLRREFHMRGLQREVHLRPHPGQLAQFAFHPCDAASARHPLDGEIDFRNHRIVLNGRRHDGSSEKGMQR